MTGLGPIGPLLATAGLVVGALLLGRLRGVMPRLGYDTAASQVSIVVPARNEADTLPILLHSLGRLDPRPREVIVVDDGSVDGTAAVAQDFGVQVISTSGPPRGWVGKPWACQVGAEAATGSRLLFLDADTWLEPDALGRLVADEPGGLRSVAPYHVTGSATEQLSAFPNLVAMMGSGAFAVWGPSRRPIAFGPCVFVSRSEYERVGGHASVRDSIVEDIDLARRFAAEGIAVECRGGRNAVSYRMYPNGAAQLVEGWTKNLAYGARSGAPLAVVGTVWWIAACASIALAGITDAAKWAFGDGVPWFAGIAWVVAALEIGWMLSRIGRFRWWTSGIFVLPLGAFLALFSWSLVRAFLRRPATWRGRRVDARARENH